jgi:hypothetical protein
MKNSLKKDKSQDYGSSDLERDVTSWLIPLPSPPDLLESLIQGEIVRNILGLNGLRAKY